MQEQHNLKKLDLETHIPRRAMKQSLILWYLLRW